jgi:ribonuclease Z
VWLSQAITTRPELLREACQGAQLLVHEATYTQAVAEAGKADFGHSTAAQVAAFAASVKLPHLVLTHFSARYQGAPSQRLIDKDIREEAAETFQRELDFG